MTLKDNERVDRVNDDLELIQKTDGLTFGTDALLLAGYARRGARLGAELGAGSGIISMLLLSRNKCERIYAFEVQKEYAELVSRNAELNSLSERLFPVPLDIREAGGEHRERYDAVFTNPPYMRADSGRQNEVSAKNIARHEIFGTIGDFAKAGARLLKYGGSFLAVYRPDRLADLTVALREAGLEIKRLTFVHADAEARPSMLLLEAKRGARSGMAVTRPLIIYRDGTHREYTRDMIYIDESGSFPRDFYTANGGRNED